MNILNISRYSEISNSFYVKDMDIKEVNYYIASHRHDLLEALRQNT